MSAECAVIGEPVVGMRYSVEFLREAWTKA
jgi:hypothetical protein